MCDFLSFFLLKGPIAAHMDVTKSGGVAEICSRRGGDEYSETQLPLRHDTHPSENPRLPHLFLSLSTHTHTHFSTFP